MQSFPHASLKLCLCFLDYILHMLAWNCRKLIKICQIYGAGTFILCVVVRGQILCPATTLAFVSTALDRLLGLVAKILNERKISIEWFWNS